MSVNRSSRMNLFSLMQSISEMDDISKEQVVDSLYSLTWSRHGPAPLGATLGCETFFIMTSLHFFI